MNQAADEANQVCNREPRNCEFTRPPCRPEWWCLNRLGRLMVEGETLCQHAQTAERRFGFVRYLIIRFIRFEPFLFVESIIFSNCPFSPIAKTAF